MSNNYLATVVNKTVVEDLDPSIYEDTVASSTYLQNPNPETVAFLSRAYNESVRLREMLRIHGLERLDLQACRNAYRKSYQTRGSVLLVQNNEGPPQPQDKTHYDWGTTPNWMCDAGETWGISPCDSVSLEDYDLNMQFWRPLSATAPIVYCMSEKPAERCKLQSSLQIMVVVLVSIAGMMVVMVLMVFRGDAGPLLTVGDAVASFLREPDTWTKHMCLASQKDFR